MSITIRPQVVETVTVTVKSVGPQGPIGLTGDTGPAGSPGGAPDWGDIGGILTNQTDLQAELDAKTTEAQAIAFAIALGG